MSTSYQIFLLDGIDKFLVMDTRLPTGPRVGSPEIVDEPNCASVLSFDITADHPLYHSLTVKNTWLEVYETGVKDPERFRILDADPGDDGVTSVKCEAVMAVFNDTVQPHWEHTGSPVALIDRILANHNAQAVRSDGTPDPMRQIRPGVVSADLDPNNLIVRGVDTWPYPSTMDILKRSTCDSSTGGHLRVRTTDGMTYLDWLSTGALSEQVIRWGGTLQQWQCAMSGATIITACEPVGAQIDDEDGTPTDERVILTAADGADLLYTDSDGMAHYGIINPDAYAVYGLIVGSNTWDDVRTTNVLKARAAEYAQTNSLTQVTITASIVDQHLINPDVAQLTVNDRARIIVPILGMADQVMTVARRRRSLVDASGWSVELGAKQATLMDAINKGTRAADQVDGVAASNVQLGQKVAQVQVLAAGSPTIFPATPDPAPPYKKGDMWLSGSGVMMFATVDRVSGVFTASDWTTTPGPKGDTGAAGSPGKDGARGADGAAGRSITSIVEYYAVSTSGTTPPTVWQMSVPTMTATNKYLWNYEQITYANPTSVEETTKRVIGVYGDKGDKGDQGIQGVQGIPGTPGVDGSPRFTWVKYADSPTSGMSDSPTDKKYLGIAYNKLTEVESTTYGDYTWSVIKGTDGVPGTSGKDGTTSYTWVKYADSPTSGMSDSPTGKAYIGLAFNKTTATESTTYGDYAWQRVTGEDGDDGRGITSITNYYQVTSSTTAPTVSQSSPWTTTPVATSTSSKYLWNYEVISYTDGTSATTTPAIISTHGATGDRGATGSKGDTGAKGDKGADGRGISSTEVVYQAGSSGSTEPTGTWGTTIPTVAADQYLWTRTTFTFTDSTTKVVYTVGKMGATGAKGDKGDTGAKGDKGVDGKGISSTDVGYQSSTSGTTTPTGTWVTTIPTVAADQYLWTRTTFTYTDSTTKVIYTVGKMGATGAKGDKGATGDKGAKGDKGDQGDMGTALWGTAAPTASTAGKPGWLYYVMDATEIQSTWRCTAGTNTTSGNTWVQVSDKAVASAVDVYSRDASQGLDGMVFDGSSTGVQAATIVTDVSGALKGKAISKPASTSGTLWIHDTNGRIRLKQGVLYEVFATVRVPTQTPAATGTCYIGVDGLKRVSGAWQYVNSSGANSSGSQHYPALNGSAIPAGVWTTYRGYFIMAPAGATSGTSSVATDPTKPGVIHPAATHIQPMIIMSYSGKADQVEISDWGVNATQLSFLNQTALNIANLAVTVSTVQSNIVQTKDQVMSEVAGTYVTTSAAQKTTDTLRSEMSQTTAGIDVRITQTNETVKSVSGAVVAETATRESLIRMGPNGVEVGASDSPAKSIYGMDGMKITVNGVEVANYKSTGAETSQLVIRDRLQIGNRIIEASPGGGMWIRGA